MSDRQFQRKRDRNRLPPLFDIDERIMREGIDFAPLRQERKVLLGRGAM